MNVGNGTASGVRKGCFEEFLGKRWLVALGGSFGAFTELSRTEEV